MAGRMPPRRAVNGRRDSVASADGPRLGAGRRRSWQLRAGGRTSGARRPFESGLRFQGEEAPPRSLSPARDCGAAAAVAHSHWPARNAEARLPLPVPLEGAQSFQWSALRGMARHQWRLCSGRDGIHLPQARSSAFLTRAGPLPRAPSASPRAHVHLPTVPSPSPRDSARTSHSRWTGSCRHEGVGTTAFVGFARPI
jgi:hypothetical protein